MLQIASMKSANAQYLNTSIQVVLFSCFCAVYISFEEGLNTH